VHAIAPERVAPAGDVNAPPAALALEALRRDYDERPVLRDVSLRLESGQTLAVLGPNGAGKTTLLRILATLLRPTAGSVSVLGEELPRRRFHVRGRIGYLGHEPMLYRELTVAENLRLHARLHRLESPEPRISELLERAGIARRATQRVRDQSAGTIQRAAVCRALLHSPELLLLDEPLSHLDPSGAAEVGELIAAGSDRTRVIVSHDVDAALADADRLLVLAEGGSVAFEGPAGSLSPADARALYGAPT
jgi:heme ABC exporter ATP-binding subunit CcmA